MSKLFDKLKSLTSTLTSAASTVQSEPTTTKVAREVIAGDWGSGNARIEALKKKGYNPTVIQNEVNRILSSRELIIDNQLKWAHKIVDSHKYKYVFYDEPYGHECAVCHPHNGANKGWQCIGWSAAVWHHGGLPIPCNCGVIDNSTWEKILNAKTDSEALSIARSRLKLNDIKVIRNKNGLSKSLAQPGDIAALFNGNQYQHMYIIASSSQITDSTSSGGGYSNDISFRSFSGRYASNMKVLIRYTGKGLTKCPKKTINEVAKEVIKGLWLSGDARKRALTEAGFNYDEVQKEVNRILNNATTKTKKKKSYSGAYPNPKKYLEYGDKGTEVKKLQKYLNWYFDGAFYKNKGKANGIYDKITLKYVKKMQTKFFGAKEADGKVGPKTIAKMKTIKK